MSWNYRVIAEVIGFEDQETETPQYVYTIHEVYYDKSGIINGWVDEPAVPMGNSIKELGVCVTNLQRALTLPILERTEKNGKQQLVELVPCA